ncbi:hypothetical protein [Hyphomonas johnsonii]|jgi:hypothetical protein|uniref:Uncharacterized protein n=1 Tax=Hyphomonas johnsonii MHS-2 TaxID=1280950 RepID=A0A059FQP2_9PROT|nr:hypothetical protein [Hyphomonas johnsonii]KCZ92980.1 hypothetical protein HJO_08492 [Hyphomonas johnsonii MHS-2]
MSDDAPADWKLKLRYGQTTTDYSHFAVIADGAIVEPNADMNTQLGPCVLSLKAWATDADECADMLVAIANQVGFKIAEKIDIYATEPDEPPKDKPFGYDLRFTPYAGADTTIQ